MTPESSRKSYEPPVLKRYRTTKTVVQEYQLTTGVTNSGKCTDIDQCTGEGAGASLPSWMLE